MSSSPTLPPGDANEQAAAADDEAFLEEIGLRDFLQEGVVRLLEVCPRPSSLSEAVRVLSAQITRDTKAEEDGESKDAAAAETTLSMIVDTVVRVEAILHNRETGTMPPSRPLPLAQRT